MANLTLAQRVALNKVEKDVGTKRQNYKKKVLDDTIRKQKKQIKPKKTTGPKYQIRISGHGVRG